MSPVALAVCCANILTSEATTAKPLPAAPARAASIVALSARSEVCDAIASISLTTAPMRSAAAARLRTVKSVWLRSAMVRSVASLADVAARATGGFDGMSGALRHIPVARAEMGGGDANFLAGSPERDGELIDGV